MKKKKMKRRAAAHLLYLTAQTIGHCWFLIDQLCETSQGASRALVAENALEGCLTEKEERLLKQRNKRLYTISEDLRQISHHLRETSR